MIDEIPVPDDRLKGLVTVVRLPPQAKAVAPDLEADTTAKALGMSTCVSSDVPIEAQTELDGNARAQEAGDLPRPGAKQVDILLQLTESAALFHSADGRAFADLDVNGHRETWPIRSKGFRQWLARRYFKVSCGAPSSQAMQSALDVVEAKAHFDAPERAVHVRVAALNGRLYLDLADDAWRAVEIDATGWRLVESPPVRFRRVAGMRPLPVPVAGGTVEGLRKFMNLSSDADFVLVVGWLLASLRNRGPYPVLVVSGEQGAAKSTASAILRSLIDPNSPSLRALPREDRDLFIAANNRHILAFDNVSGLPAWISDSLCRLATGGGFATRQMYTDEDEVLFDATRPLILNGIEDMADRPDLADRSIFLTLKPIPEENRVSEDELWAEFESARPSLLGALLDAAAVGLARMPTTALSKLPRMADFALWVAACESALWPEGTFFAAYCNNRESAIEKVIDADPVSTAVCEFIAPRRSWTGTATELLNLLSAEAGERVVKAKSWPQVPNALSGRLRRAATALRKVGVFVNFVKENDRKRTRKIDLRTE